MTLKTAGLLLCLSTLVVGVSSCKRQTAGDDLPVIGLDQDGKVVKRFIGKKRFVKRFTPLMNEIGGETLKTLESHNEKGSWELQRVSVGLMVVAELEVTEQLKFEFEPSFELRFEPLKGGRQ